METILRDGASDKVIAMFTDEQVGEVAPTDLTAPSEYGFADRAIDAWAEEIVKTISRSRSLSPSS